MDIERVAKLEVHVASLKEDMAEIKEALKKQSEQQEKITAVIAKWKQGAGIIFFLGAVAMWVIDHWEKVVGYFKA